MAQVLIKTICLAVANVRLNGKEPSLRVLLNDPPDEPVRWPEHHWTEGPLEPMLQHNNHLSLEGRLRFSGHVSVAGDNSGRMTIYPLMIGGPYSVQHQFRFLCWKDVSRLPTGDRNGNEALRKALDFLKEDLTHGRGMTAFRFVSRNGFTATELRRVYESILGVSLDHANCRKRILRMQRKGLVWETTEKRPTPTRPATIYRTTF